MRPLKELRRHINGIKGKDGNTKDLGPNPLEYVGVTRTMVLPQHFGKKPAETR
jgi:hypothetical protein